MYFKFHQTVRNVAAAYNDDEYTFSEEHLVFNEPLVLLLQLLLVTIVKLGGAEYFFFSLGLSTF